jgi:HAD domain in Swiss Army Knife RNA repair proteins
MRAKEPVDDANGREPPLLMVDIDGVVSLFGGWEHGGHEREDADGGVRPVDGSFHSIDGIPHFLSSTAAAHLLELSAIFELVWASGWEERANEHLPHLLGLPRELPFLRFPRITGSPPAHANAHWKLDAIDAYAGARALAWVDDALNDACRRWARARAAPTLLVQTDPKRGLTAREVARLAGWAQALSKRPAGQ